MAEATVGVLVPADVALEVNVGLHGADVRKLKNALTVEAVLEVYVLAVVVGENASSPLSVRSSTGSG